MSDEFIKKDDAIKALGERPPNWLNTHEEFQAEVDWDEHISAIKALAPADVVERKYGEWIRRAYWSEGVGMGEDYGFYYECSNCKEQERGGYHQCGKNFCHACGADMRGTKDE